MANFLRKAVKQKKEYLIRQARKIRTAGQFERPLVIHAERFGKGTPEAAQIR